MNTQITVDAAHTRLRADYYSDVRDFAADVIAWWHDNPDADREALVEYIEQGVDGAGRVIYTAQAMDCLRYSDNDSAGPDELGADGFDWKSGIPWSQLAYFAFRADIMEQLDAEGLDVNNPEHATTEDADGAPTGRDGKDS